MRFPPSLLDEIRARLPVSQVVGRRVRLRRQGREFIGLSPFNAEKTPSFTVNDQKGFYHCFSSGKHGDIFRFLTDTEGVSFPEAVERLAQEAGVPLPAPDPQAVARERQRTDLLEVIEAATSFFEAALASRQGDEARDYLQHRGVSDALQRQFRLGYAPNSRHALKEHLAARGIGTDDMARAGLIVSGSDIAVPFDRFRDRLIFPITDFKERVVAFGGRALSAEAQAKYLNSPETELFHKGRVLFNLASARRSAQEAGTIIVTEGYMDVIALAGAGIRNAVAPLGTALTEDQLALLWRLADEPIVCFDGDDAGRRAAFRLVDLALPALSPGKSLRFALLPEGQDPDDIVREHGATAIKELMRGARPLSEMVFLREAEAGQLDTPERRAAFEARLRASVERIADIRVRRHYETAAFEQLRRLFAPARTRQRKRDGTSSPSKSSLGLAASSALVQRLAASSGGMPRREAILLLALVNHPALLAERAEEVAAMEFTASALNRLKSALLDIAAEDTMSPEDTRRHLERTGRADMLARAEQVWEASGRAEWWVSADAADIDAARAWDHTAALHRKHVTLHKELKAAEIALQGELSEENLARLADIQDQLANIAGTEALVEGFGQASGRSTRVF